MNDSAQEVLARLERYVLTVRRQDEPTSTRQSIATEVAGPSLGAVAGATAIGAYRAFPTAIATGLCIVLLIPGVVAAVRRSGLGVFWLVGLIAGVLVALLS